MRFKKTWMLYRRIQIVNTFLISIFSYLANFYVLRTELLKSIDEQIRAFVPPLSPKSISLYLLRAPASVFNFRTPLRDVSMMVGATILSHIEDTGSLPLERDLHPSLSSTTGTLR